MLEALVILLVLLLDQGTKILAANILPTLTGSTYPLIEGVFHFTYVENRGAAFGMLQGQMVLFFILTPVVCAGIVYILIRYHKKFYPLLRIALALIVGGAIGNLIDRAFLGYVRDMLDFRLIHFPVFNVADSAVCVGAAIMVLTLFFSYPGRALMEEVDKKSGMKKPASEPESAPSEASEAEGEENPSEAEPPANKEEPLD